MIKKFTEGLVFGGGFAISFITLWYVAAYLISPMFVSSQFETAENIQYSNEEPVTTVTERVNSFPKPFYELDLEEKIKQSSVIALAKYETASDGKRKAIIKEFLKKEAGTDIYYNVGDEYAHSSYYPKEDRGYGDGLVIFFTGSPAEMKLSMSYSGDRITGLGDLPVKLLRNKCKKDNA